MAEFIILGHENPDVDSIISGVLYESYLKKLGWDVEFVIPDSVLEEENVSICQQYGLNHYDYQKTLIFDENTKFILVDHYKHKHIKNIIEIIDHHPTAENIEVSHYINQKASSTSCFIVQGKEDYFSKHEIELAIVAAMVGTASFHSTKTRKKR